MKNPVKPRGIDPGTFRLVAQRLNHYATPGPLHDVYTVKFTYIPLQIQQLNVHIYLYNNIFTTFLLHVSVCYTSSSGRATCFSAQNHMVTCVIKNIKHKTSQLDLHHLRVHPTPIISILSPPNLHFLSEGLPRSFPNRIFSTPRQIASSRPLIPCSDNTRPFF
jgi:hypothetical protein